MSLEYRLTEQGSGWMVIDATTRNVSNELAGRLMMRDEVVNTPLAEQVFELVDAIWLQDDRIKELSTGNPV